MAMMPIPHTLQSAYDVTPQSSRELMGIKLNMWVDSKGVLRKRPGYSILADNSGEAFVVDEAYSNFRYEEDKYITVHKDTSQVIRVGRYRLDAPTAINYTGSGLNAIPLNTIQTPNIIHSYNTNEFLVFIPGFANFIIFNTDSPATYATHAPSIIPSGQGITCATYLDGYVIIVFPPNSADPTNTFYYSAIEDYTSWSASRFAKSSYKGDPIVNLFSSEGEFYILNTHSLEMWQNDGQSPFSRIPGGAIDIESAQTKLPIPSLENTYYFIDISGRLIAFKNRQIKPVAYQAMINLMRGASVDDVTSMSTFVFDGTPYIALARSSNVVVNLLNEDFSVFNQEDTNPFFNGIFSTSTGWGSGGVTSGRNGQVLLATHDNTIHLYEYASYQERTGGTGGSTQALMCSFTTGWIDHNTDTRKRSDEIRLNVLSPTSGTTPEIYMVYRDDGETSWSTPVLMELTNQDTQYAIFKSFRNGMYRIRQWCFYCSNNAPFSVGAVNERVTELTA